MQRQRNGYVEPVHWMASSRGGDIEKLFFLTHVERAPAAAVAEEGRKSVRALRRIDPRARLADLVVLGLIAADKTLPAGAVGAVCRS